jgi:outer membrane lipoprotein-sorting protein
VTYLGGPEEEPAHEETEDWWRLWLAKPDRIRTEFSVGEEFVTAVLVGDTWWSWSPSQGAMTNAGDPHHSHGTGPGHALVDPAPILPAVDIEIAGRSTFLGRGVLQVVATPSPLDENDEEWHDWHGATHGLGGGADEYRLLVDEERGVLLRAEARLSGQPFRLLEIEEVAFDEDLPQELFTPPQGLGFDRVEPTRSVPLAELPGAVPFVVLVPEHPPFGPPSVTIEPPHPRHGISLQAHIHYGSPMDGEEDRQFWLIESAEPIPERDGVEWREEEGILLGDDRRMRPALRIARLERAGTHVEIQSYWLEVDELRDLARSLVPLPSQPSA